MKLSEFKDEKAIEVIADLMAPIGRIAANPENAKAKNKTVGEFAAAILKNNVKDVMTMFAVLSDEDPTEYHCTAATVILDVMNMLSDPALMQLFGVQSKTPALSGSASENTEGQET